MSEEDLELSRAYFDEIARSGQQGLDPGATVSKMAEFWGPAMEWDMSEAEAPDIAGVYRGIEAGRSLARVVCRLGDPPIRVRTG